jgi:hypothetical protein
MASIGIYLETEVYHRQSLDARSLDKQRDSRILRRLHISLCKTLECKDEGGWVVVVGVGEMRLRVKIYPPGKGLGDGRHLLARLSSWPSSRTS